MVVRILYIIGFACLALGGWLYYDSLPEPLCTIEAPERVVDSEPFHEQEIVFTLTNPSSQTVRIVGLADC